MTVPPAVLIVVGVAIVVGLLSASFGSRSIENGSALGASSACAAVAAAVAAAAQRGVGWRGRVPIVVIVAIVVLSCAGATLLWANVALDRSAASTVHGSVREVRSPRRGGEIIAVVDDGRVVTFPRELSVGCRLPSLPIDIRWHPGALGDAWIEGASCATPP